LINIITGKSIDQLTGEKIHKLTLFRVMALLHGLPGTLALQYK